MMLSRRVVVALPVIATAAGAAAPPAGPHFAWPQAYPSSLCGCCDLGLGDGRPSQPVDGNGAALTIEASRQRAKLNTRIAARSSSPPTKYKPDVVLPVMSVESPTA